jgi:hypothetical protein
MINNTHRLTLRYIAVVFDARDCSLATVQSALRKKEGRVPDRTGMSILHRCGRARRSLALIKRANSWLCHPHARTVTSVDHSQVTTEGFFLQAALLTNAKRD